jgi:hypothetical protein
MTSGGEKELVKAAVAAGAVATAAVLGPAAAGVAAALWMGSLAAGVAKDCRSSGDAGKKS